MPPAATIMAGDAAPAAGSWCRVQRTCLFVKSFVIFLWLISLLGHALAADFIIDVIVSRIRSMVWLEHARIPVSVVWCVTSGVLIGRAFLQ